MKTDVYCAGGKSACELPGADERVTFLRSDTEGRLRDQPSTAEHVRTG